MIVVKLPFTSINLYFSTNMCMTTNPIYWRSIGLMYSVHSQSMRLLPTYTYALRGMNIHGCDFITCLTAANLPLLSSDKRTLRLLGIPFFGPILEILVSEFLQQGFWLSHPQNVLIALPSCSIVCKLSL